MLRTRSKEEWGNVLSIDSKDSFEGTQGGTSGKEPANAGGIRDTGLILGSGRSPRGGHGNPLQYSCLENPMDRGAWRAAIYSVAKRQTQLKQVNTHNLFPHLLSLYKPSFSIHSRPSLTVPTDVYPGLLESRC